VRGQGDKIGDGHVVMSRAFYDASGFTLRDEVEVGVLGDVPEAGRVELVECERKEPAGKEGGKAAAKEATTPEIEPRAVVPWQYALEDYLGGWAWGGRTPHMPTSGADTFCSQNASLRCIPGWSSRASVSAASAAPFES
jgi:hypothetical protein